MRQFQLSNENWLDPQSCSNIQNVAIAVGNKIMFSNFRGVAEYIMYNFPALEHLRVIWGRCSESLVETKEQPENLRFIDINKDFQDMDISNSPKDSNENSFERDHFSHVANSMQRYYSDIVIPINPRYWEKVKFEVQMMACYRQRNSKAQTEPALWIETFDCRVPCDSKGRLLQTQQAQPL